MPSAFQAPSPPTCLTTAKVLPADTPQWRSHTGPSVTSLKPQGLGSSGHRESPVKVTRNDQVVCLGKSLVFPVFLFLLFGSGSSF
jgi:hypothetical protein